MAKKRVAAIVKIQIPAGAATPAPPVGTALGPHGVNIMDFCKLYNAQTESAAGHDRSRRDHDLRRPHVHLHHQDAAHAGAAARSGGRSTRARPTTGARSVGTITDAQLSEIAKTKLPDLNANDLEAAKKQVAGTARSMGIKVG